MTTASVRTSSPRTVNADVVVLGFHSDGDGLAIAVGDALDSSQRRELATVLKRLGASAKVGEVTKLPSAGVVKAPVLVAAGLGSKGSSDHETLRRAAGAAARALAGTGTVAFALPADDPDSIRAIAEGALLGGYAYDRYLEKKHEPIGEVVVLSDAGRSAAGRAALDAAVAVADAVNYARDLVNTAAQRPLPRVVRRRSQGTSARHRRQGFASPTRRRSPTRATAASWASAWARRDRRGSSGSRTTRPRRAPTSHSSARASPSTPAVCRSSRHRPCRR